MKNYLKRNIFMLIGLSLVLIALEIFTSIKHVGLLAIGLVALVLGFMAKRVFIRRLLFTVALFFIILSLVLARSTILLLITLLLLLIIFRTNEGNEFFYMENASLHPYANSDYMGIQLVQPQSGQRTLIDRRNLGESVSQPHEITYEWDDINLVFIGGNTILDVGNTILPEGESVVIIRKVFGRTRLIVPSHVGLSLNISALTGRVVFETQVYDLTGENFRWKSPNYAQNNRRLKVLVSIVTGDVEVIML